MENSPVAISGQLPRFHIGPSDPHAAFGVIDLDTSYPIHVEVEVLFSLHKGSHGCRLSSVAETLLRYPDGTLLTGKFFTEQTG